MSQAFVNLATVTFGLVLGSFMNVLIYRLPRGLNIATPPSACPKCGYMIKWYSNIPVISYILQGGKCKNCRTKISLQYPLVELLTALLFFAVGIKFGWSLLTVKYCIFTFILLAAAGTDISTRLDGAFDCGYIPDHYTIGGTLIGYICAVTIGDVSFYDSLAGSGAGVFFIMIVGFLFKLIRKIDGIGDGDAFLMGMVGSFSGVLSILPVVTFSALLGSIIGVIITVRKKDAQYQFPFGPMICASAMLYIFFGYYIITFLGLN